MLQQFTLYVNILIKYFVLSKGIIHILHGYQSAQELTYTPYNRDRDITI